MRILLTRRNIKKRAAANFVDASAPTEDVNKVAQDEHISHAHAFEDLTDQENPDFRYEL